MRGIRYTQLLPLLLGTLSAAQDATVDAPSSRDSAALPREAVLEGREVRAKRGDGAEAPALLRREDLERSASLADALGRLPGVQVRSTGGMGGYSTLSLRGSPSEQVEVRLDGVPLGGSCGSSVDLGPLSLDGLERAQLSQAGGFGADGAPRLDLISRRGWSRLGGSLRAGSFGEKGASGFWGNPSGSAAVSAWWETSRNDYPFPWDNGTPANPSDDGIRRLANNDFAGWGASGAFRPTPQWELAARWEGSDRGLSSPLLADPRARWKRQALQATAERTEEGRWSRVFHASWRRSWSDWNDPGQSAGYRSNSSSEETADDGALGWTLRGEGGGWWDPRAGMSVRWESSDRRSVGEDRIPETPGGTRLTLGWPLGWSGRGDGGWGGDLDGRVDVVRDGRDFSQALSGAVDAPDTSLWRTALRGQARLWKEMGAWTSWAGAAWRERLPDFQEWMGDDGGGLPNPGLRPEKSANFELGGRGGARGWEATATAWYAIYDDPIDATTLGSSPLVVHANLPGREVAGLDGRVTGRVGPLSLLCAGTLQKARISDGNPALDGKEPRRTPHWKASTEAKADLPAGFSAGWTLDAQGSTWATEMNSADDFRPGRVLHGAWVRWRKGAASVFASVRNIGDRHVEDIEDLPLSGRSFLVRLDLDFANPGKARVADASQDTERNRP